MLASCPIYLVRHGESTWNARGLTQGQVAHPALTPVGRLQARTAAGIVAADLTGPEAVARIVSSDLARAQETARIIATALPAPIELDPRWRELHLGERQGTPYAGARAALDRLTSEEALPGGESRAALRARVVAALDALDSTGPTIVVTHGLALQELLAALTGTLPEVSGNATVVRLHEREATVLPAAPAAEPRPWG